MCLWQVHNILWALLYTLQQEQCAPGSLHLFCPILLLLVGNDIRDQDLGTRVRTATEVAWIFGPLVDMYMQISYTYTYTCICVTWNASTCTYFRDEFIPILPILIDPHNFPHSILPVGPFSLVRSLAPHINTFIHLLNANIYLELFQNCFGNITMKNILKYFRIFFPLSPTLCLRLSICSKIIPLFLGLCFSFFPSSLWLWCSFEMQLGSFILFGSQF